ncbi:kinetochore protein Spc24 [Astyanax mexicanus]|uniref:Kinetochore protein Spc24 n=2 Tax=Astyanax mexicanus TaxID=7994 RepID=A0A8B9J5Q8_ASTMX|nr:kinetochore protein Spc24 [Astyanax mexicanus]XP_015457256.1 kinetochore protein Spc24 [Astyanax mexicanus]KAG9264333.1 kinetochore protein Spc24 [Astyanax mexicanus]
MLQNDALHYVDLENTGEALIELIESSKAEDALRAARNKQQALFDHHTEAKRTVTHLLNSLVQSEEFVGHKLLGMESQKSQMMRELESVEQEVQLSLRKSHTLDSEIQFLQNELQRLKENEQEIQTLQQEVDEDTTEVIPSAIYLAQLYFKVTKIKLELNTEPHILRGAHYGTNLATPINIDTSTRSPCEVSDELWSLVSTDW